MHAAMGATHSERATEQSTHRSTGAAASSAAAKRQAPFSHSVEAAQIKQSREADGRTRTAERAIFETGNPLLVA